MNESKLPAALRFVHLSDLHIQAGAPEIDPNADVRRQLSNDLSQVLAGRGPFTGILFSGDVAFSGAADQYARASQWLSELTQILGLPPENVWVVPGNHDVEIAAGSAIFQGLQAELRNLPQHQISERLSAILNDRDSASHLFTRLKSYNDFALQFGCEISPTRPYWTARWDLADGSIVTLRGITSPLLSALNDNDGDNKLVVGEFQVHLNSPEPAINLAMCHHPPSWLRDWEDIETYLDTRSSVQVFGHRHIANAIIRGRSLRLSAGAVHPERGPGWEPRYNIVEIAPSMESGARVVRVTLQARKWHRNEAVFGPASNIENQEQDSWVLPLNQPVRTSVSPAAGPLPLPVNMPQETYVMTGEHQVDEQPAVANRGRRLSYELARLNSLAQAEIGLRLAILEEEERSLPARMLVPLLMGRAAERGKLAELWDALVPNTGDTAAVNPFSVAPHD